MIPLMWPNIHTIYAIEHILTSKVYVGRSSYVAARRKAHFQSPSKKVLIGREMIRLGADQFTFYVLDIAKTSREAGLRERFWTHLLESNDPRFGYNSPNMYKLEGLPTLERVMLPVSRVQPLRHGMWKLRDV